MLATYFHHLLMILLELAPWLIFGMLLAGALHVFLPEDYIRRHLGRGRWSGVFKAVALGIPMPLCSCGVIPTTLGLRRDGASPGAAMGFLISTPQTGVDSILVSAAFLGWPFALFKVGCALVSGVAGGMTLDLVGGQATPPSPAGRGDPGAGPAPTGASWTAKVREALTFALGRLMADIYLWLIIGLLVAAAISTAFPAGDLGSRAWAQGVWGMLIVLALSVPMYVCSTASVPMAAALVSAGLSPGAALVFLIAGPTTNVATVGMVGKTFGWRGLAVYLGTVVGLSMGAGLLFNQVLLGGAPSEPEMMMWMPPVVSWLTAALVVGLCAWQVGLAVRRRWGGASASCCGAEQPERVAPGEASCCGGGAGDEATRTPTAPAKNCCADGCGH